MASRRNQREELRSRRIAAENARIGRARRRRLTLVGATVAIARAVFAAGIRDLERRRRHRAAEGQAGPADRQPGAKDCSPASRSRAHASAIPTAPVTLVYYGDLQCPACRELALADGFSGLIANDVRGGNVKRVYRSFETATRDPRTLGFRRALLPPAG